jgi:2-polyprenyl-3-methyl-5-hydroxy-6-metoxy-1,4-benzoquinol methylase
LDCTCGIGTQALGLAALGYSVVGTDISTEAIRRARTEAETRGLNAQFRVADLRSLSVARAGPLTLS